MALEVKDLNTKSPTIIIKLSSLAPTEIGQITRMDISLVTKPSNTTNTRGIMTVSATSTVSLLVPCLIHAIDNDWNASKRGYYKKEYADVKPPQDQYYQPTPPKQPEYKAEVKSVEYTPQDEALESELVKKIMVGRNSFSHI